MRWPHVDECLRLHLLDVGARGEGLLAARQHNRTDCVIALKFVEGGRQLMGQGVAQRVKHPRPIQRDHTDIAAHVYPN